MNTVNFCLSFILLLLSAQISAMELPKPAIQSKHDIQILNETGEDIVITFIDKRKLTATGDARIPISEDLVEALIYEEIDADRQSRYSRKFKHGARFNIRNFREPQEIKAGSLLHETEPITKELLTQLSKPGTKIIELRYESIPTKTATFVEATRAIPGLGRAIPKAPKQKKLIATITVESKSLQELEQLEKGIVKKEASFEKTLIKGIKTSEEQKEKAKADKEKFEKAKEERLNLAKTLGAWGKLMPLIFDESIEELTPTKVYEVLGFKGTPTAHELFDPILAGMEPATARSEARKKLRRAFYEEHDITGDNKYEPAIKAKNKFKNILQIL